MTPPRAVLLLLPLVSAVFLLSCGGTGNGQRQSESLPIDAPCREGCESNLWPRLILGVVAEHSGQERADAVRVSARLEDGTVLEGNLHGCPNAPGIVCSYSFFTAPRDRSVTLLVEPVEGGLAVTAEIPTGHFNRCGRDIAYVLVTLAPGSPPEIGEPRTVSPCATL